MYILIAHGIKMVLNEEEKNKADKLINDPNKKFIFFKNQTIQIAFISGIFDLETYYEQEKSELSLKGKWRCMRCGIVHRFGDQCNCGKQNLNFLTITTNDKLLTSSD